jgi:hypothetical protein
MSDLIEKMERSSWNPVTRTVDWEAAARVMLEDMRPDISIANGWHTQFRLEELALFIRCLDAYAKEKGLEGKE